MSAASASAHPAVQRPIHAPPATVYGVLADYRTHHPRIMPPRLFGDLEVERGGTGAGTVFHITVRTPGPGKRLHMRVDEPDPGRVLTETDLDSGVVTTFTVTPHDGGTLTRISSQWAVADGLRGLADRLLRSAFTRLVFAGQLRLLSRYAASLDPRTVQRVEES